MYALLAMHSLQQQNEEQLREALAPLREELADDAQTSLAQQQRETNDFRLRLRKLEQPPASPTSTIIMFSLEDGSSENDLPHNTTTTTTTSPLTLKLERKSAVYPAPTQETKEVQNHKVVDALNERGLYTGSIRKHFPHGYGTMKYPKGREYTGNWDRGHWSGHGTLKNMIGDVYEGMFVGDQKEGQGTLIFSNGRIFKGRFQNDQMREGRLSFPDTGYYKGLFQGGKRNGFGLYVFADGSHYEGQWKNDQMHGRGRMEWTDGCWYNGDWYYGIQQGLGLESMRDGSIRHQGHWHKGQPVSPKAK